MIFRHSWGPMRYAVYGNGPIEHELATRRCRRCGLVYQRIVMERRTEKVAQESWYIKNGAPVEHPEALSCHSNWAEGYLEGK